MKAIFLMLFCFTCFAVDRQVSIQIGSYKEGTSDRDLIEISKENDVITIHPAEFVRNNPKLKESVCGPNAKKPGEWAPGKLK